MKNIIQQKKKIVIWGKTIKNQKHAKKHTFKIILLN
jgi:hypothetical protein